MLNQKLARRGIVASVLLCAALSSAALTLGRSRGVALIGRPLDLAISVTLDNPAQASELCPEADVFHGDSQVDRSRVTVRVDPVGGVDALLRVRSTQAVDEPVVTVYLRLGCSQKSTRRYVLLAEEPGELPLLAPSSPAATVLLPRVPSTSVAVPRSGATAPSTGSAAATGLELGGREERAQRRRDARNAEAAARETRRAEAVVRRAEAAADAPVMRPRGAPAARAERSLGQSQQQQQRQQASGRSGARLQMDLLDLSPERAANLRSSADLLSVPTTSEQVRAEAAALWRAINAQPQDVLRDVQRVQAMETDLNGLRVLVASNERTLTDLRGQLDQARQERMLTLGAIALLALVLSAMVVTWWLRRREREVVGTAAAPRREWWRRGEAAVVVADAGAAATRLVGTPAPAPVAPSGAPSSMDLRVDESMFDSLKAPARPPVPVYAAVPAPPVQKVQKTPPVLPVRPVAAAVRAAEPPPSSPYQTGFVSSQVHSMRMVKAEELVDIQQQADFFMSLGQTEQAIELLENHIHTHEETSALVWLDLLAIYRALKRRDDYELLRTDFHRVFNAEVPSYDSTPTRSGGLEDYPRALSRISALWPSPKVMEVIEESIFRKPGMAEGNKPFDLEAYRELVMLYNLGREVVDSPGVPVETWAAADSQKSSFGETSMQPLSAALDSRSWADSEQLASSPSDIEPLELSEQQIEIDSVLGDDSGPRTRIDDYPDPTMPRPSPRLGLDIDLTGFGGLPESEPLPLQDSQVDFELSQPGSADTGKSDLK